MPRLLEALRQPGLSAIAEVKRCSPSSGALRLDANPALLAPAFASAGAAAVSVLVDERFGGTLADLSAARANSAVPLLAKGFFREEGQIRELKRVGAEAVLLILADLDDTEAGRLLTLCAELDLDALVEVRDEEELKRALELPVPLLGVNARDLASFTIDRRRQLELIAQARHRHPKLIIVAESGVVSRAQAALAELAGADAVLVGSALMRAADPAGKLRELLFRPLVKICGLTRQEDVDQALAAGADLLGFILASSSPRRAERVFKVPEEVLSVAVIVGEENAKAAAGADLVQAYPALPGRVRGRDGVLIWQGRTVARVLDLPWGEADSGHLARAQVQALEERVVLAGRLDPTNVAAAIRVVRPWAVDAASGLESAPGVKEHELVKAFVAAARA